MKAPPARRYSRKINKSSSNNTQHPTNQQKTHDAIVSNTADCIRPTPKALAALASYSARVASKRCSSAAQSGAECSSAITSKRLSAR